MKPLLGLTLLCAAIFASTSLAAASPASQEVEQRWSRNQARWDWTLDHPPSQLSIVLARGEIKVVRWSRDRVEMHATSPDPENDGSAATILVSSYGQGLRIIDRYPPIPLGGMRECYPPDDEHGGAWLYEDRISIIIFAPYETRITQAGG